jgi:hypothetical protein
MNKVEREKTPQEANEGSSREWTAEYSQEADEGRPQEAEAAHRPAETLSEVALENAPRLYIASAGLALIAVIAIAYVWFRVYNAPPSRYPGETVLLTEEQVLRYMDEHTATTEGDPPIYIPTGVVIQTIEFKGPYTVQVAGYVWQKYADGLPPLDYGVVFPEADTTTFTKVYETQQEDGTLVGWNFKTTLRQQFDYANYPLDRQLLWLRMWHPDFEKNVYLIPDVHSYTSLVPATAPGLDRGLVLENWQINSSYFSFRLNQYNTTFGIDGYAAGEPQPELYFNIPLKRLILSPLVARGIAPLVILLQLFVIVMVIGSDSKRLEQFGVRPGAVIFTCAAFFFAVLIAENALRDDLKWYGIVYLEYLHILTYFVILAVAANSVALVAFPSLGLFKQDNLWVEVFYWPGILFILFVITWLILVV